MGNSVIFNGSKVKALKSTLNLNGGADVISSTTNPQSSAVDAALGSLLLNTSTGKLYRKNDSGSSTNWSEVGSGSGLKNYIAYPDFNSGATTGWSKNTVTVNASTKAVSGNITAGAASMTIATSATTPIAGAYDLAITGTIAQGAAFISDAFAIDREDYAKVLQFSFAYEMESTSGAMNFSGTSANTWAVWIAEVTTATPDTVVSWIQPAGVYNLTQSSGVGIASGTFQTTATGTAYRLVLVCITAPGVAVELHVDDFRVGPQALAYGPAVSDWTDFTAVLNGGTASSSFGKYRRVGDSMHINMHFILSAGGSYTFSMPAGFTMDATKIAGSSGVPFHGVVTYRDVSSNQSYLGSTYYVSASLLGVQGPSGSGNWSATVPVTFGAGDTISVDVIVPISGWSSNTLQSADTDTRMVAAFYYKSSNSSVTGSTPIDFDTKSFDTHSGTTTGAAWKYTAPVSGIYKVSAFVNGGTGVAGALSVFKNGASYGALGYTANIANTQNGSLDLQLNAGDYVDVRFSATATINGNASLSNTASWVQVERLSGPATIQATESVIARYKCTTADTTSNTDPINYDSKDIDTHGAVTTGASWKFTAPVSGRYLVNVSQVAATATSNTIYLYVGGSFSRVLAQGSANIAFSGSDVVALNAGDYIDIRNGSGTTLTLTNDSTINHIAIARLDR